MSSGNKRRPPTPKSPPNYSANSLRASEERDGSSEGEGEAVYDGNDDDPTRQDSSSGVLRVSSFQGKVTLNPLGGHNLGGGDGFRSTRAVDVDATQPEDKRDTEEGKTMAETLQRPMEEAPVPEEKQVATDDIHIQIDLSGSDSCTSLHC